MGQQHSTNESLIHQYVRYGNIEGIKALHREGADIERIDSEGRTPLSFACLNPDFFPGAKTLIELGANVNAYRSGGQNGTPLHHAAKKGLERTVKLLLSHGANASIVNDDSQTPRDIARALGYSNVVRTIENHISLFSGWMREFSRYGSPEVLVSRKVWVVLTPRGSLNLTSPSELELAIYSSLQRAQPRLILALGKAIMEQPNFHQADPAVVLTYMSTSTDLSYERLMLGPAKVGDKQQLGLFCSSCRRIPQAMHPSSSNSLEPPPVSASAPPVPPDFDSGYGNWAADEAGPSTYPTDPILKGNNYLVASATLTSLAPLPNDSVGTDLYPTSDSSSVDFQAVSSEKIIPSRASDINKQKEEEEEKSSCTICENAPVEGACVPCGHMAGCMKCLKKIQVLNLGCPICRTKIDQVIRIFAVRNIHTEHRSLSVPRYSDWRKSMLKIIPEQALLAPICVI